MRCLISTAGSGQKPLSSQIFCCREQTSSWTEGLGVVLLSVHGPDHQLAHAPHDFACIEDSQKLVKIFVKLKWLKILIKTRVSLQRFSSRKNQPTGIAGTWREEYCLLILGACSPDYCSQFEECNIYAALCLEARRGDSCQLDKSLIVITIFRCQLKRTPLSSFAWRQWSRQSLPHLTPKKHYLLELAVNIERAAAENLRNLAAIIIQDGAAGANMTEPGKATMLIKARQVPCRLLRLYWSLF